LWKYYGNKKMAVKKSSGKKGSSDIGGAMGGMGVFMIVMVVVMVIYSVPLLRNGVAMFAGLFLDPLFGFLQFDWVIAILVLAVVTGTYSSLLQKYTIDYSKMQRVQKKMKEFQKEFREAQLSGDEKRTAKLNIKREKMMKEQMEMSQEQFKPMMWIMIITVPIFLWILTRIGEMATAYEAGLLDVFPTIIFPYLGGVELHAPAFFLPAWIIWYMICSIALSQIIRKTLNIGGV